jgi:hypothetical protein
MEPHEDARLRLAALRHPAAGAGGSPVRAGQRLDETVAAFLTAMALAGHPGAAPLPGPAGAGAAGWAVATDPGRGDGPTCWLDTAGRWWRAGPDGAATATDHAAATVSDLDGLRRALDRLATRPD